ncbi:MAG: STM4011 family radical SAM protein, partial [Bacteroidota bacterium]
MKDWSILYRGSLSSCNYDCDYCPFGKTKNTRTELTEDAKALRKFVDWVAVQKATIGMLFTPWGEALIRKYYQKALTELSHLPKVRKVAIQTNLSCSTAWMAHVNKATFALWTTYHPTQISKEKFIQQCRSLDALQIRYSVGVVGFKEEIEEIKALRAALPSHIYLWINAYKRIPDYYTDQDIAQLKAIDPLFQYNLQYHPSLGKYCKTG